MTKTLLYFTVCVCVGLCIGLYTIGAMLPIQKTVTYWLAPSQDSDPGLDQLAPMDVEAHATLTCKLPNGKSQNYDIPNVRCSQLEIVFQSTELQKKVCLASDVSDDDCAHMFEILSKFCQCKDAVGGSI